MLNKAQLKIFFRDENSVNAEEKIKDFKFWLNEPKLKIDHYLLVKFLEGKGIKKVKDSTSGNYILIKNSEV
ncbi:hypothetical protein N7U66_17375 [Lacinutrix neustonica]|uniref:Uncharacterized protein n=1 Tax=Lacinutrix neustonica TaxID=2980107 RepID=A0A9E8MVG5_9FLAO|nr:hypothetical protein [Lacinutrix neustonica]WAC01674.1 hypothetical protein N7U66_17375 [Lacinutrix neustonica]